MARIVLIPQWMLIFALCAASQCINWVCGVVFHPSWVHGPSASIRRTYVGPSGCHRGGMAVMTPAGHQPAFLGAHIHPRHGLVRPRPATAARRCGHRHLAASKTHVTPPPPLSRPGGRLATPFAPAAPPPSPPRGVPLPRQWPRREMSTAVDVPPAMSTGWRRQRHHQRRAHRYGRRRAPQQRATAVAAVRPVPGHRIGFVTRVCYAENPASHRFGHSGTSAGIWVSDGPKCYSFDIIGFTTVRSR